MLPFRKGEKRGEIGTEEFLAIKGHSSVLRLNIDLYLVCI